MEMGGQRHASAIGCRRMKTQCSLDKPLHWLQGRCEPWGEVSSLSLPGIDTCPTSRHYRPTDWVFPAYRMTRCLLIFYRNVSGKNVNVTLSHFLVTFPEDQSDGHSITSVPHCSASPSEDRNSEVTFCSLSYTTRKTWWHHLHCVATASVYTILISSFMFSYCSWHYVIRYTNIYAC